MSRNETEQGRTEQRATVWNRYFGSRWAAHYRKVVIPLLIAVCCCRFCCLSSSAAVCCYPPFLQLSAESILTGVYFPRVLSKSLSIPRTEYKVDEKISSFVLENLDTYLYNLSLLTFISGWRNDGALAHIPDPSHPAYFEMYGRSGIRTSSHQTSTFLRDQRRSQGSDPSQHDSHEAYHTSSDSYCGWRR